MYKKYRTSIILIIIFISLNIYCIWHKEFFFTIISLYGLMIKFFLSDFLKEGLRKILAITIWTAFTIFFGLTVYTNYYLPHGPSYPTGEIICRNDDRGPCGEKYIEDTRNLNIPEWAKFLRESKGELLLFGLLFAVVVISGVKNKN